ncbi:hypothetical protein MMC22_001197 [Lobaria immixta]|nr:hypothetical protein [Lobaria immixta]
MGSIIDSEGAQLSDAGKTNLSNSFRLNGSISEEDGYLNGHVLPKDRKNMDGMLDRIAPVGLPDAINGALREEHNGLEAVTRALPSRISELYADFLLEHRIYISNTARNDTVNAVTSIWAAWAIMLECYTASQKVKFGVSFQGNLEMVPLQIFVGMGLTVSDLLRTIQNQHSSLLPSGVIERLFVRSLPMRNGNHSGITSLLSPLSDQAASEKLDGSSHADTKSVPSRTDQSALNMEFEFSGDSIFMRTTLNSRVLEEKQMRRIMDQFEHVLHQVCSDKSSNKRLAELELISPADIHEINSWPTLPIPLMDSCAHHLIEQQARQQPDAVAVSSWDAQLTYGLLNELSSRLAHYLKDLGVGPEVLVPFCFEKSAWAVTAMLGTLKAGGACIGLDANHPMERLKEIIEDSNARIILTSVQHSKLLTGLQVTIIPIDEAFLRSLPFKPHSPCTSVNSKHPAYVTFTSGTTGQPKGIVIEHNAICVSGRTQSAALRLGPGSRVLQFAAYSFDISNGDILNTLMNGGCVCVPSEDERSNDLVGFINRMRVNWACLTPSVASLLQPSDVPTLKVLVLCGEPIRQEIVQKWADAVYLVNAYGPAETTILCTSNPGVKPNTSSANLGRGMGALTWIVKPSDHNHLCPLGCIGEILIEGPLLARGYLNDSERSAAFFIQDPPWTTDASVSDSLSGSSRRFYKSGDLGFFNTDGTITFVSRKDTQVKVRGQRVELREVEHHLRNALPATVTDVVAEVISVEMHTVLVAFVCLGDQLDGEIDLKRINEPTRRILMSVIEGGEAKLAKFLPAYMTPSIFLPLKKLPLNRSGKIDRRNLRKLMSGLTFEQLTTGTSPAVRTEPSTELEKQMRAHWARVLDLDQHNIGADDNFIKLGGDSLTAMKLVAACRADGIPLSVATVFHASNLSNMAARAAPDGAPCGSDIAPLALLTGVMSVNTLRDEALVQCVDINDADFIEDMYPCTPLQEGLMALSLKQRGSYIAQDITELPRETDLTRFRAAWEQVIQACAILRTRVIQSQTAGSLQVVLKSLGPWYEGTVEKASSLDEYVQNERSVVMDFGQPLSRYAVILDTRTGTRYFIWTIHHVLYDGWSMPLIKEMVETTYAGRVVEQTTGFNHFIQEVMQHKSETSNDFWRFYFEGAESPSFPRMSSPTYQPHAQSMLDHSFRISRKTPTSYTIPTVIRAAWALLIGRYVDSNDITFGATLAGRNVTIPNVDTLIGPTIATVPVRIRWNKTYTIEDLLQDVQAQSVAMIPFEHSGLQNIQNVSEEARAACQFQSLLIIQPMPDRKAPGLFFTGKIMGAELSDYGSYAIILQCMLTGNEVVVKATYDENVVNHLQTQRYLNQFEHAVCQLCSSDGSMILEDLETISAADKAEISKWNATPLEPVDSCYQVSFKTQVQLRPGSVAVCGWDGTMTYEQLDQLSTRLACHLITAMDIDQDNFVPLCFEKSVWTMVAILGTLKAGAAIVPMDPFHPLSRHHKIVSDVQAKVVLCSKGYHSSFLSVCDHVLIIDRPNLELLPLPRTESTPLPVSSSRKPLYGLYTSGSTGTPKGVVIEHGAFLSSATAYGKGMFMNSERRVLLYSSYSFDISMLEILTPLIFGACVCVVSDKDRLDDLGAAMARLEVDWTLLTPTVARTIDPKTVPSLEVLLLGGEAIEREDVAQWAPYVRHIINAYGPSECSVVSSGFVGLDLRTNPRNIGRTFNAKYWVTALHDHNKLAPIGAAGELLIEGPILGRGYLNNAKLTEKAFIKHPAWSRDSQSESTDQPSNKLTVQRRFYKTGDIVHYDIDGNVIYLGRKDTQVKLRGQRIELGEVQYHILRLLPEIKSAVVEVVSIGHDNSHAMLVAFICLRDTAVESNVHEFLATDAPTRNSLFSAVKGIEGQLSALLPKYMIPSLFLPLSRLPMTTSRKVDRAKLRNLIRKMSPEELAAYKRSAVLDHKPSTPAEEELQGLWATVLNMQVDQISTEDSFFSLGGDSILAIRLVAACRTKGLSLSVPQTFQAPKLVDMALLLTRTEGSPPHLGVAPFALFSGNSVDICAQAVAQCGISNDDIEDIYPCTAMQESLIVSSTKTPGAYVARFVVELPTNVDLDRFRTAVEFVVNATPILRTRIFQSASPNLLQVVLRSHGLNWSIEDDISIALAQDLRASMSLNGQLAKYTLVKGNATRKSYFVWTIQHALYDGWSMALIRERINQAYKTQTTESGHEATFNRFVRHTVEVDEQAAKEFWRKYLEDAVRPTFPAVPPRRKTQANQNFAYKIKLAQRRCSSSFTLSTIIRAAWALLVQCYSGSSDIVFGATLSGRDTFLEGIEEIVGPTIVTVPVRVVLDANESTIATFLQRIQDQMTEMIPYQHVGIQGIQRVSEDAYVACQFQNLLVIQPAEEDATGICSLWSDSVDDMHRFNSYALMVQCTLEEGAKGESTISTNASYDSDIIDTKQMQRIMQQFENAINRLLSSDDLATVSSIELISPEDMRELATWNDPERIQPMESCLHELFEERARLAPESTAVSSWDGELTYRDLDQLASHLCSLLRSHGVKRGSSVVLCFEKSMWMAVASLATLKAGGALVSLDHKHPVSRLEGIVSSVNADVVLTSWACSTLLSTTTKTIIVNKLTFDQMLLSELSTPNDLARPDDIAAVVFTSGSTGIPKGYILEHRAICSSAMAFGKAMFLSSKSRIFQFGSHAHDAMILEILVPLIFGACICIPTEEERLSKTAEVMHRMAVNWTFLTPSVAGLIKPDDVPELDVLVLGGEALSEADISQWTGHVQHLINGYGPGECSIFSSACIDLKPDTDARNIGRTFNAHYWITIPDDANRLCPIGGIGELLVEGPIIARGYLHQPKQTAAAFIEGPRWATNSESKSQSKLYRTGDLVRYNTDGTVNYIGRIDNQVKIRGQRTELAEIEHQLRRALPNVTAAVAEIVDVEGSRSRKALVAFLCFGGEGKGDEDLLAYEEIDPQTSSVLVSLGERLADSLPIYMIPSHFIPFRSFPLTRSGKTDRRKLCLFASKLSVEDLNAYTLLTRPEKRAPCTPTEILLQSRWATTLNIEAKRVGRDHSFFKLGGDSIMAIHLVTSLRNDGLSLAIIDVFRTPVLCDMARAVTTVDSTLNHDPEPFSLLGNKNTAYMVQPDILSQCETSYEAIEDIYPCTPLQEGLMALSIKRPGSYVAQFLMDLPAADIDLNKFRAAWEHIFKRAPILRTRICDTKSSGSMQVVLRESVEWLSGDDLDLYLAQDRATNMTFGGRLARYAIISGSKRRVFVWTIHHALYDAWTTRLILRYVNLIYAGQPTSQIVGFNRYIKHIVEIDQHLGIAGEDFWRSQLVEASPSEFPALPSTDYQPQPDSVLTQDFSLPARQQGNCTMSTLIWAAWALVISRYTGSLDVVFGTTLTGRYAPIPNIEDVLGPTINTVPIRHKIDLNQTVDKYLEDLQDQATAMIPFQAIGLQRIQRVSSDAYAACQFRSLLAVQPMVDEDVEGVAKITATGGELDFASYPLTVDCTLTETQINVAAAYDRKVIDQPQMLRIMHQFKHAIAQLCTQNSIAVASLEILSPEDIQEISQWNRRIPPPVDKYIDGIFRESVLLHPEATAVHAWDGQLTYSELDRLSTSLAYRLVHLGVGPEVTVPLCFNKSMWIVVAMIATSKAGGAFVTMDPSQPFVRLRSILTQTQSKSVLCSTQYSEWFKPLCENTLVVSGDLLQQPTLTEVLDGRHRSPRDAAYVIFTSGSTGDPKGCIVTHQAYCTSLTAYAKELVNSNTRSLQFASYSFDACILEIFTPLVAGGCVCIPSDQSRLDDIPGTISDMAINWAALTPSMARLIDPKDVPSLKTLLIGGEALSQDDVPRWRGQAELFHMYGPTECAVVASRFAGLTESVHPNNIGIPYASNFWIADSSNHDELIPIGAIGELLIDGPILARGYLHDSTKTAASFIENPKWLPLDQRPRRMYKTGDLVRYNSDGTMNFVGRKDTQIKLRGQRIQLDEVEYHLHKGFPDVERIVAELVHVERKALLVAFLSVDDSMQGSSARNRYQSDEDLFKANGATRDRLASILSKAEDNLTNVMPAHMIPSAYIPIQRIPTTVAGKTDRGRLRRFVSGLSSGDLDTYKIQSTDTHVEPSTLMEREIQALWASVLGLGVEKVGARDSFFKLGGDSIMAIRLVSACRAKGISLSATAIFRNPKLCDMAIVASTAQDEHHDEVTPFSLLGTHSTVQRLRMHAVAECGSTEDLLEDIYPCTALQEGLMAISIKKPGAYMAQGAIELPEGIHVDRFREAWETIVESNPILRTRIIQSLQLDHGAAAGFMQVVLKESVPWQYGDSLSEYLKRDSTAPMSFGGALTRYAIIYDKSSGRPHFVWTIHHALYDAWSMSLILKSVNKAYKKESLKRPVGFNKYIGYLVDKSGNQASEDYWRSSLQGAAPSVFPPPPPTACEPQPDSTLRHLIEVPERQSLSADFTISTIIRAAWAVLISRYTDSHDVVFGAILAGRTAPVHGIEEIAGPTINTVPIRVILEPHNTVRKYLRQIQDHSTEMIPFETLGLQGIQRLNENAHAACQFQNLLLVQPAPADDADFICPIRMTAAGELFDNLSTYALAMQCSLGNGGIEVSAGYDSSIISRKQMQRVIYQFDYLIQQMCQASESLLVEELDAVSLHDRQELKNWSGGPIQCAKSCLDEMFEASVRENSERSAINAWDGDFTYYELNEAANHLAKHLIDAGVGPESKVPLCFHKSRWTVVAMLGVVKAGGAIVPMDPAHPRTRLEFIIKAVKAKVALCSSDQAEWLSECCEKVIVVDSSLQRLPSPNGSVIKRTSLSSALYIIFTSGSTGEPKGCIIEHGAFCSSVLHHAKGALFGPSMRNLQLASYSFGAAIAEIFSTLLHGGCICIVPNEARANIVRVIKEMDVNFMFMSPTFARLLPPQAVPTLKTLILGSEAMSTADLEKWVPYVRLVQGYGQTECSTIAASYPNMTPDIHPKNVGYPMAARFWIVDASNHNTLAPLGAVGELLVEGPILARGYLNEPGKTATAFIKPPSWREDFAFDHCQRLYKTGDLARYHDDGALIFMGRKDNQVKLRGQRVELGEIEYHLRRFIPDAKGVVVELVETSAPESKSHVVLVAFLCLDVDIARNNEFGTEDPALTEAFLPLISGLAPQLSDVLPSYMIPSAYLPLGTVPMTTSGKVDRRRLRELASALSIEELASYSLSKLARREPSTAMEKRLQRLWAAVLNVDVDFISADDNFLQLGGDSINAIRLVSACRSDGMSLSVPDIFKNPILSKMAEALQISALVQPHYMPFSSVDPLVMKEIVLEIINQRIIDNEDDIEDILETTYMQGLFVACGLMERRSKTNYISLDFPASLNATRLEAACRALVTRHEILRTVFIAHQQQLLQVVLRSFPGDFKHYRCGIDIESFASKIIETDNTERAVLGKSFVRFMFFDGGAHGFRLTLRINHAQFDGMSFPMMVEDLAAAYRETEHLSHWPGFSDFIYSAREVHETGAVAFYSSLLAGSAMTEIATQPKLSYYNSPVDEVIRRQIPHVSFPEHGITFPTVLKAAWSMVLAEMTGKMDLVFGYLVNGRNLPMPSIDEVVGPCINITPVRIQHQAGTALELLQHVKNQNLEAIPYENYSFEKIVASCTQWPRWTRCSTIVQCQHIAVESGPITFGDLECHLKATNPPSDLADLIVDAGPSGSTGKEMTVSFLFSTSKVPYDVVAQMASSLTSYITSIGSDVDAALPFISERSSPSRDSVPLTGHNHSKEISKAVVDADEKPCSIAHIVRQVWDKVLGSASDQSKESIATETPFYDIWGSPIAAAHFAACYRGEGLDIKMEDIIEHPSMRLQSELLRRKRLEQYCD